LNLFTLNAVHRWFVGRRLRPYVGGGAGAAIPHVEATVGGVETDGYQLAGWAAQGLAGLSIDVTGPLSVFVEYKLSWADIDAELNGGGSIRHEIWTQQLVFGFTFRF
jgi:lipid A oxidase